MNNEKRTPGRVDEEAALIEGVESVSQTDSRGRARGEEATLTRPDTHRVPGYVDGPSKPIEDDIAVQLPETIGVSATAGNSLWKYAFLLFVLTLLMWLAYVTTSAITGIWQQSIWLAVPLAVSGCVFLVILILAMHREYKALNAVDALEVRREQMRSAIETGSVHEIKEILGPTLKNLRKRYPGLVEEFEDAARHRYTASEYLKQFDNIVLSQIDQEASDITYRFAMTTGVAVTIVPHPALDAAVALWRGATLVRNIGNIYGLEPTGLSSLRLLRHTIATAIIAAGADMAADAVMENAGEGAVNMVFSKLGEGTVMAWRIYRLGNYAQKLCRPVTS